MNADTFDRLRSLRRENDAAGRLMDEMRPRFDRIANRHENSTAPRAVSAFQLFQTPSELAARLVALLSLDRSCRVLEPSAGLGRILDAIKPHAGDVTAVEISPTLAGEFYRQERPEVRILQRDFLTVSPQETGLFDAVAMNPPFHMRADVRHILHARTFLKPGGRLAAICMDTHHRETALRSLCSTWEKLPPGTFKNEGTQIAAVLLSMEASR